MNAARQSPTDSHDSQTDTILLQQWGVQFFVLAQAELWLPVLRDGTWEQGQRAYFIPTALSLGCDLFIDIGANNGIYTLLMANESQIKHIVAFEPCEPHFSLLRRSVALNGCASKCELHRIACSDENDVKPMYVFSNATPSLNQFVETKIESDERIKSLGARIERIHACRLDDKIAHKGRRIAIKIDTEGHEIAVIRGAERLFRDNDCFLQIESFGLDITTEMKALGYQHVNSIKHDHYFAKPPVV